jgi:hypothetical protein
MCGDLRDPEQLRRRRNDQSVRIDLQRHSICTAVVEVLMLANW